MANESKRTPGPWKSSNGIIYGDGMIVATTSLAPDSISADRNAAFIVRAVNSHADLLAALKETRELLSWWQGERGDSIHAAVMEHADAAIAKATS